MSTYSLTHLSDSALLSKLTDLVARDRATTAALLAHLAEVDARKLYLPAAYPSMFAYCVGELRMSEDAAAKRIQAARAARRFPAIFQAVADGRLHLTAVGLLAPHLTEHSADDLLVAAAHKSKSEIELLLAERFPRSDVLTWMAAPPSTSQHAPAHVEEPSRFDSERSDAGSPGPEVAPASSTPMMTPVPSRVQPLSAQSSAVQFTLSRNGQAKLQYAQELLGHQVPPGDIAAVFERALDALIPQLEKRKFAATEQPRPPRWRKASDSRHIPADVRRAVWKRDGGQCTFQSETGHRCPARRGLEFDHVQEFARGGEPTVSDIRLLCRAHNQHAAECSFGSEFMRHKRIATAAARSGSGGSSARRGGIG